MTHKYDRPKLTDSVNFIKSENKTKNFKSFGKSTEAPPYSEKLCKWELLTFN